MMLFSKKRAEGPEPTPAELARQTLVEVLRQLDWTIESSDQRGCTLLVPKINHLKLRCRLMLDEALLDCEIDAGLHIQSRNFSAELGWDVLRSNTTSRCGHFRVREEKGDRIGVCVGSVLDSRYIPADVMCHLIKEQASTLHEFIKVQLNRGNLVFPIDFLGYPSTRIPIRMVL